MYYVLSDMDIRTVIDLLEELVAIGDFSNYYKKEVDEAIELLKRLDKFTLEQYLLFNELRLKENDD